MFGRVKGTFSFSFLRKLSTIAEKCAEQKPAHVAVMAEEALHYLKPEKDQVVLDMTFGAGGHSRRILESAPNIKLLALDRDPTAFKYAQKLSEEYPQQITPLLGKFSELADLLKGIKQNSIDSIIFDFGCSSMQFDEADRGFSVSKNGPLDMRMDGNRCPGKHKISEEICYKQVSFPLSFYDISYIIN